MSGNPDPVQATDQPELVFTPTLSDYRESKNLLHFGQFSFFVQAWRLQRAQHRAAIVVGSLFTHVAAYRPYTSLSQPRCILGRDPGTPARLAVTLITLPEGEPDTWTAGDIAAQAMVLIVPAVVPWIPGAIEVRLKDCRQT
jgi:hypothetical protein